jgi:transposase
VIILIVAEEDGSYPEANRRNSQRNREQNRQLKEDLKIAMSIPGVGFTSASTLLAEIGDIADFKKPEQLAAWSGLVLFRRLSIGWKAHNRQHYQTWIKAY